MCATRARPRGPWSTSCPRSAKARAGSGASAPTAGPEGRRVRPKHWECAKFLDGFHGARFFMAGCWGYSRCSTRSVTRVVVPGRGFLRSHKCQGLQPLQFRSVKLGNQLDHQWLICAVIMSAFLRGPIACRAFIHLCTWLLGRLVTFLTSLGQNADHGRPLSGVRLADGFNHFERYALQNIQRGSISLASWSSRSGGC